MAKKKELLSLRKYAKHRGVALSAVQKAIRDGRIVPDPSGKIDPKSCDRQWDLATDPAKQRTMPRAGPDLGGFEPGEEEPSNTNFDKFYSARARNEDYKARLAQLKFEQQCGQLVEAEAVKKRAFESARTLREALIALPNRIGVDLAAETDPIKVINMLTRELTLCLEEMSGPRVAAAVVGLERMDFGLEDDDDADQEDDDD